MVNVEGVGAGTAKIREREGCVVRVRVMGGAGGVGGRRMRVGRRVGVGVGVGGIVGGEW